MGNQSNKAAEIMKIIDQSQYDDEIIDGIEMGDLDLSFSDMSEVKADCMMAHYTNLRAFSLIRVSLRDYEFNAANLESCNLEETDIAYYV